MVLYSAPLTFGPIHIAASNIDCLSLISLLKNTNLKMEQGSL